MAYAQVSYGSQGSSVRELQELLNQNGYNLSADGIFGSNTQAAVRDYQQKNGLSVDGIVGNNTWGALTSAKSGSSESATKAPEPSTPATGATTPEAGTATGPSYSTPYEPSDAVKQAEAMLQEQLANKPGEYTSPWQSQLNEVIDKIMNREDFSYDLNGDALYQQYKDKYITQGKQAMMDTMGQAAALTGGYGSSYSQAVGQQAYQSHLQNLNDVVPELYQMAMDQYNQKGQDLYNQYSLLGQQEEQDYGRHRDNVGDYYTQLQNLYNQYMDERNYDYSQFADNRDFAYQTERDKTADEQWQKEFDEAVRQYNQSAALASSGGSGGGSSGGGSSYSSKTAATQQMLRNAGYNIAVDGIWGPKTQAAYDDYYSKGSSSGSSNSSSKPATKAQETASKATYTTGELIEAAAAGYTKKQVLKILADRGVDTNSAAVKADVDYAFSR